MANIFKEQKAVNEHPKRNNFDLSKKSNVSLKFSTLYPVYCQPVIPGDSFSIETAFNLKLLPVVFPVQTKMRAHMHFFYVRNKNLWSNWENWISNLVGQSEHPHPYISVSDSEFKCGSIHDFLGVPTSVATSGIVKTRMYFYSQPIPPFLNFVRYAYSSGSSSSNVLKDITTASPVESPNPSPSKYFLWAVPLRSGVVGDKISFDLLDGSESHEASILFNDFVQSNAIHCDVFSAVSSNVDDLLDSTLEFTVDLTMIILMFIMILVILLMVVMLFLVNLKIYLIV